MKNTLILKKCILQSIYGFETDVFIHNYKYSDLRMFNCCFLMFGYIDKYKNTIGNVNKERRYSFFYNISEISTLTIEMFVENICR